MQNLLNPLYSEHLAAVPHYKAHSRLASRSADPEAILNHSAIKCYVENANAFITGNDTAISNTSGACIPVTGRRYLNKLFYPMINAKHFLVALWLIMMTTTITNAQPTITFYPSNGTTLTRADVDATLEAHGLTRECEFHAIIENTVFIDFFAFNVCKNLLSVSSFSVEIIGKNSFRACINLSSIDFPNVTTIHSSAFLGCEGLEEIVLPTVKWIHDGAFWDCKNLRSINLPKILSIGDAAFQKASWPVVEILSVSLGTDHQSPTLINFGELEGLSIWNPSANPFGWPVTKNTALTIGMNVLPPPDLSNNTWHFASHLPFGEENPIIHNYEWKSINIVNDIKEGNTNTNIYYLGNNSYKLINIDYAELFDITGILIKVFENEQVVDLNCLPAGAYILRFTDNNVTISEKIIVY